MDRLLEQVIEFTARERGVNPTKISSRSRLSQDLGTDGDDAVEFFELFGERFGVDLRALWEDWDQYFSPEGPGSTFVLVCAALMFVGQGIHTLVGLLPFWLWGSGLIVLWVWPLRCWPQCAKGMTPITVQDLVHAANRKQWYQLEADEEYAPRALHY